MSRLLMSILWPSFLTAMIAEGCFFALFDPHELLHIGGWHELPAIAGYTIGFFFFWTVCALASALTYYLGSSMADNRPPS